MTEDMLLRNLAQKTIDCYTYHIGRFAKFIGKPVEDATPEDVRSFHKGGSPLTRFRCRSERRIRSRCSLLHWTFCVC